jgi:hypothetical protein
MYKTKASWLDVHKNTTTLLANLSRSMILALRDRGHGAYY